MSNDVTAEAWYRIASIRERERKMALARVQADMHRARARLQAAEARRDEDIEAARGEVTGRGVSAATLALVSDALAAGRKQIDKAAGAARDLDEPLEEARAALTVSARQRRVAEKWLARRRERERTRMAQKVDRAESDRAANRIHQGGAV